MAVGIVQFKRLTLSGAGTQLVQAAVSGKKIVVVSYSFAVSATTALPEFQDATAGTVLAGPWSNAAPVSFAGTRDAPAFETAVGEGLDLVTAGAGLVQGVCSYYITEA